MESNRDSSKNPSDRRRQSRWLRRRRYKSQDNRLQEVPYEIQKVIRMMHEQVWGRTDDLMIRNGRPWLNKRTKVYSRMRIDRPKVKERRSSGAPPRLHRQHLQFFSWCRRVKNGTAVVEVADGLPVSWKLK